MIAVAGGKGGSGKTTTTVGLARALSRRGAPVVAADADWDLPNLARLAADTRCNAATGPGGSASADGSDGGPAHPDSSVDTDTPSVVEAVRSNEPVHGGRIAPTVLGAPAAPADADARTTLSALDEAVPDAAPTLVDCPAGASPDAAAPLRVADRCLIVTRLRRPALRDAAKTAAIARRLDCHPVGTVVVGAESVPDAVAELLDCPVLGRTPSAHRPLSDPSVRAAYDRVAGRLVEKCDANRWRVA